MYSQVSDLQSFSRYLDEEGKNDGVSGSIKHEEKRVEIPEIPTGEVVAGLLSATSGLLVMKMGKKWELEKEEAEVAGEAYGAVIDKYFPDVMGNMGVEITALMITVMLVGSRLGGGVPDENKKEGGKIENEKGESGGNVMQMPISPKKEGE